MLSVQLKYECNLYKSGLCWFGQKQRTKRDVHYYGPMKSKEVFIIFSILLTSIGLC